MVKRLSLSSMNFRGVYKNTPLTRDLYHNSTNYLTLIRRFYSIKICYQTFSDSIIVRNPNFGALASGLIISLLLLLSFCWVVLESCAHRSTDVGLLHFLGIIHFDFQLSSVSLHVIQQIFTTLKSHRQHDLGISS